MLLVAAVIAVFANGITDQYVGYNAVRSLRDNPDVHGVSSLSRAMSLHLVGMAAALDGGTLVRRPLLSLSFAVNAALLGASPRSFHLGNILVHVLATLLLFGIVRRTWSDSSDPRSATLAAAAVALLWGVHPLHTESVTYLIQRAESQAALCMLASLYALRRSHDAGGSLGWQLACVVACAAASTTKESGAVTPILVLLYDTVFLRPQAPPYRFGRSFYLALAATWILPAALVGLTLADASVDFRRERIPAYIASQPRVWLEYVRWMFWPQPLCLHVNTSEFSLASGTLSGASATFAGGLVGLILLFCARAWRRRQGLGFLGLAFALLLAPTSLIATNDVLQQHRTYLPSAIVAVAVVAAGRFALARCSPRLAMVLGSALVLGAAGALASATRARNLVYHEPHAVYCASDRSMGLGALARQALATGHYSEAEALLQEILQLPETAFGRGPANRRYHRGRALNDLAAALTGQQRFAEALRRAAEARATLYDQPQLRHNAAVLAAQQGHVLQAKAELERLAAERPNPIVESSLGAVLLLAGEETLAREHLERSVALQPNFEFARKLLESAPGARVLGLTIVSPYDDAWLVPTLAVAR